MNPQDKLIIIAIMLSLMALGAIGTFNLAGDYINALDTSFGGGGVRIFWTIILRVIIGPLMMIVPGWIILNVLRR